MAHPTARRAVAGLGLVAITLLCVAVVHTRATVYAGTIHICAPATVTGSFAGQYLAQNTSWQMWMDYVNGAGGGLEWMGQQYNVDMTGTPAGRVCVCVCVCRVRVGLCACVRARWCCAMPCAWERRSARVARVDGELEPCARAWWPCAWWCSAVLWRLARRLARRVARVACVAWVDGELEARARAWR